MDFVTTRNLCYATFSFLGFDILLLGPCTESMLVTRTIGYYRITEVDGVQLTTSWLVELNTCSQNWANCVTNMLCQCSTNRDGGTRTPWTSLIDPIIIYLLSSVSVHVRWHTLEFNEASRQNILKRPEFLLPDVYLSPVSI